MADEAFKLEIGDEWLAISTIANSQSNPKKSIAELVENSIDAHAKNIKIFRKKIRGDIHIQVSDDGEGVPTDGSKMADFKRLGRNICNSLKRTLKDRKGIQGEFGIGLLGFWCVGEELIIRSKPKRGVTLAMMLKRY